jgi:hypothetical protein
MALRAHADHLQSDDQGCNTYLLKPLSSRDARKGRDGNQGFCKVVFVVDSLTNE